MAKTIVGLYDNFNEAQAVVRDLESMGFRHDQISIVANNAHGGFGSHDNAAHSGGGGVNAGGAVKGAVGGAVEGGVIGGLTGLLASLALLLVPGIGPVAAIGPLSAALTGAGIGAASGGVIGALVGAGIPKEDAHVYSEGVRRGGTLVTLNADDARADEALAVFNRHNPVDIDERGSMYRQNGFTSYDEKAPAYTHEQITQERSRYATAPAAPAMNTAAATTHTAAAATTGTVQSGQNVTVPIVEEQIAVGKREVERGRARIHTYVTETPVQEQVTLREEHVTVERHAVNRPVNQADLANALQERTIEVTEHAEVPVVAKEARVVEEVTIGKETTQHTETVRDTVRRTDVDVDEDIDTDVRTTGTTTTGTTGTGYNR